MSNGGVKDQRLDMPSPLLDWAWRITGAKKIPALEEATLEMWPFALHLQVNGTANLDPNETSTNLLGRRRKSDADPSK